MKKLYIILGIVVISLLSVLVIFNNEEKVKYINYNGFKLALSLDGESVDSLPSEGIYFLVSYECRGDTKITWSWDNKEQKHTLAYDNITVNDRCSLKFESTPKLYDLVNIGDYISYVGDSVNGCSENGCKGWNVNQTNTDLYENYGGVTLNNYFSYIAYGWRVLYKSDNSVYIVSAGAPELIAGTADNSADTISNLNEVTLKYCNLSYQPGEECTYSIAHPFNDDDFYKFTSQYYGEENARHLSNTYGDNSCKLYGETYCGYNNDIIDNGGHYWFGSEHTSADALFWYPIQHGVFYGNVTTSGVRPVLKLDASILATGGAGTMTDPYTISEKVTTE